LFPQAEYMRIVTKWKTGGRTVVTVSALMALAGYTAPAVAAPAAHLSRATALAAPVAVSGGVSPDAALGTPQLHNTGKVQDVVRQLVQCGSTMYAVGRFTSIRQQRHDYTRNNIFSFSATPPYTITKWIPNVNGQVNAIAFNGSDCSHAYIGGAFTKVNSTSVSNIAEISTKTKSVVPGFGTVANAEVWTMVAVNGHLLVGGDFTHLNGTHDTYMTSIDPVTGKYDGFLHLDISGDYHYCAKGGHPCTAAHPHPEVYNQQLSHSRTLDLLEGHFTSVGGLPRQQIFMLNLATHPASVTKWTSPEWDGSNPSAYPDYQCWPDTAFYIRSAAWSPDDSTVYIADTGKYPAQDKESGAVPRTGLCDAVAAFPASQTSVTHKWVEYSGCDSYYSVAADNAAVYAAGHPRWAENTDDCNKQGAGAIPDVGLQGLDPASGHVELNSRGTALYTMSRDNADNMLITSAGLWIASANRYTVNKCGDLKGPPGHNSADHAGICLLPY
jgi:hypothetical protein